MISKEQKLFLAELIRERKDILFAPFSPFVTKKLKQLKWEEVRTELNKTIVSQDDLVLDIRGVRDTHWSNLRRATVKKLGEKGKVENKFS